VPVKGDCTFEQIECGNPDLVYFYDSGLGDDFTGESAKFEAANYFVLRNVDNEIVAASSYENLSPRVALMQSTKVLGVLRGRGFGRLINSHMEKELKSRGFGKIQSHIYVDNLASVILKLKIGYLIEGQLRDHDEFGQHEYVLGKVL